MKIARRLIYGALVVTALLSAPAFAQAPTCAVGRSGVAPGANITFTAPTLNTDGSAITNLPLTYNLYQSTTTGTEVIAANGLTGSPVSVTVGLLPGLTYYFQVSVVDSKKVESTRSNEACIILAGSVPGTVVITIK